MIILLKMIKEQIHNFFRFSIYGYNKSKNLYILYIIFVLLLLILIKLYACI